MSAISDANTQPFTLSLGGRDWLIGHSGSLRDRLEPPGDPRFEPVGSTDTETIFCCLMSWVARKGARSLDDLDPNHLHHWLDALNAHGSLSVILTDGRDVAVYADKLGEGDMYMCRVAPPYKQLVFGDNEVELDLTRRGAKSRKGVILSSSPLESPSTTGESTKIPPGALLLIRQGAVRLEAEAAVGEVPDSIDTATPPKASNGKRSHAVTRPKPWEIQRFNVIHRTTYKYARPVERSTHLFRLMPVHDRLQALLSHEMKVSVPGQARHYEDVFGNQSERVVIDTPFTEAHHRGSLSGRASRRGSPRLSPPEASVEHPARLDAVAPAHAAALPLAARAPRRSLPS